MKMKNERNFITRAFRRRKIRKINSLFEYDIAEAFYNKAFDHIVIEIRVINRTIGIRGFESFEDIKGLILNLINQNGDQNGKQ